MKNRRILISSAESNVRRAVRRAIEPSPYPLVVDEATGSSSAAAQANLNRYVLIIVDIDEPEGMENVETILARRKGESLIVLTSQARTGDTVKAMKLGASDVIEKPATPDEIGRLIDESLERTPGFFRRVFRHPRPAADSAAERSHNKTEASDEGPEEVESPRHSYVECVDLARQAMKQRDWTTARRWICAGLAIDTKRAEAYNLLGVVSEMEQDVGQAMRYYRAAVALDPTYEPARNNLHRATAIRVGGTTNFGLSESK